LGFLGRGPFGRETLGFWGLEKLGFPWILSSESSLFNGLRVTFAERNFSRPFARNGGIGGIGGTRRQRFWQGEARNCSCDELNLVSNFLQ
jgi:hypothetical protein